MVERVYFLQHVRTLPGREEDIKFIGVYSTESAAAAAVGRLKRMPGFKDCPEGFHVSEYEVDRDHWTEGFVTVYAPKWKPRIARPRQRKPPRRPRATDFRGWWARGRL